MTRILGIIRNGQFTHRNGASAHESVAELENACIHEKSRIGDVIMTGEIRVDRKVCNFVSPLLGVLPCIPSTISFGILLPCGFS